MTQKKVFILKHVSSEGAGTILKFLVKNRIPFEEVLLYKRHAFPRIKRIGAVLIMGGPMNVYEETAHPFLKAENKFIQTLLRKQVPVLGVCLGAQLIAKACGCEVMKGKQKEIGWKKVCLTPAAAKDPLFRHLKTPLLQVLQWHEDTFELPHGAVLLAKGKAIRHQAFRLRGRCYGLQFHLEVDRAILKKWFKHQKNLVRILGQYEACQKDLNKAIAPLYRQFFKSAGFLKE